MDKDYFSHHTVTQAEQGAFTNYINHFLKNDPSLKFKLPIKPENLFAELDDGIVFCKLLHLASANSIMVDAINFPKAGQEMNIFKKRENINLSIATARSLGCCTTNITLESILDRREHIMLGLIWQVIELQLLGKIELRYFPEIVALKVQGQEIEDMLKLNPREILLRWLNWHMKHNKKQKTIKNFSNDLKDVEAYLCVFNDISELNKDAFSYDARKRAVHVLELARKEEIFSFVQEEDLVEGRQKLNIMFCAQIFNKKHGLAKLEEKVIKEIIPVPVYTEEPQDPDNRELRIYKTWINSMGLENGFCVNLVEDLRDGLILLKVINFMKPGTVDWAKTYQTKLKNKIYKIQNCNYAVELISRSFDCKIVGMGGVDICEGRVLADLGIIWQLYRLDALNMIGNKTEDELVKWANDRVGPERAVKNLRDKSLEESFFWFALIHSIDQQVVDHSIVRKKGEEEQTVFNAKYALASARKAGAQVIILWQHIQEVNSKFLLIFLASLYQLANGKSKVS